MRIGTTACQVPPMRESEPDIEKIKSNYKFFRKDPVFLPLTLEEWLIAKESAPH